MRNEVKSALGGRKKIGFFAVILFGLLLFSSCAGVKINTEIKKIGIDFGNKASILMLEKDPNLFKLWTHWRPIELLMTHEEKKLAKSILKTRDEVERNAKIEKFIKWFWQRRDDGSDVSEESGFNKEIFYNRVVEAQRRFAYDEDFGRQRRCAHGRGWETDLGLIYILLGEPFDKHREDLRHLMTFLGVNYNEALMPDEIEVWYYEDTSIDYLDYYNGSEFSGGVVWILFERYSNLWRFGEKAFSIFYNYEMYYQSPFYRSATMNYGLYLGEIYKFLEAAAEGRIYDWDLEFEDVK